MIPVVEKPILLFCDRGYTITFVTLMYLANQTRQNPEFTPKITSSDFYNISATMGLDFVQRIPQEVVTEITGEPKPQEPSRWMIYI